MRPNVSTDSSLVLNGSNYHIWKVEMEAFLQSKGLAKFLSSKGRKLLKSPGLTLEKRIELEDSDERALGHIKRLVDGSLKELLITCKTARSAWKTLARYFDGKEQFNKVQLLERLMDGKLEETGNVLENVQAFIKDKRQLARRLQICGVKIPEELLVTIMLARLPDSLDTMRRILESDPSLTVDKVSNELIREATRILGKRACSHKETFEELNITSEISKRSHRSASSSKLPSKRVRDPCSMCGLAGHDVSNCWINPDSKSYRPSFASNLLQNLQRKSSSTNSVMLN